jgi:hypothetical protein
MSQSFRIEPEITGHVVAPTGGVGKNIILKADGTVCGAGEVPYGVTMASADAGDLVTVVRKGFTPVIVGTAASFAKGDRVYTGANGKVVEAPGTAGNIATYGRLEEAASADNAMVGAYIDFVNPHVTYTAP